jgi:hypothetical protein
MISIAWHDTRHDTMRANTERRTVWHGVSQHKVARVAVGQHDMVLPRWEALLLRVCNSCGPRRVKERKDRSSPQASGSPYAEGNTERREETKSSSLAVRIRGGLGMGSWLLANSSSLH